MASNGENYDISLKIDIDTELSTKIGDAEKKIRDFQKFCDDISGDIAKSLAKGAAGFDAYTEKINELQGKIQGTSFGSNFYQALGKMGEAAGTAAKALGGVGEQATQTNTHLSQSADVVSKLAQTMAQISASGNEGLLYKFFGVEQLVDVKLNLTEATAMLEKLQEERNKVGTAGAEKPVEQTLTNQIRAYEEYIRVLKMSEEERNKVLTDRVAKSQKQLDRETQAALNAQQKIYDTEAAYGAKRAQIQEKLYAQRQRELEQTFSKADANTLSEQNRLYNEQLKIRKQLENIDVQSQKSRTLGTDNTATAEQIALQESLRNRYKEIDDALAQLKVRYAALSTEAKQAFDTRTEQAALAYKKQEIDYQTKLNKELLKAKEIAAAKQKSSLQPTSEELFVQRQLVAIYAEKLKLETQLLQVQNKVAIQGGTATDGQQRYINYLTEQINKTQELARAAVTVTDENGKVVRSYTAIGQAAAQNHAAELLKVQEKAAYNLSNALMKVKEVSDRGVINTDKAAAQIDSLTTRIRSMHGEFQRLLNEKHEIRLNIEQTSASDIAKITAQIAELQTRLTRIQSSVGDNTALASNTHVGVINDIIGRMDVLKVKIESIKAAKNDLLAEIAAPQNTAIQQMIAEYDRLYVKLGEVTSSMKFAEQSNQALFAHTEKIELYKKYIDNLNVAFERFKANGKAYNEDNTLTAGAEAIQSKIASLRKQLELMTATADEAKRLSDNVKKTETDKQNKEVEELKKKYVELAVQVAEYNKLVSEANTYSTPMNASQQTAMQELERLQAEAQAKMDEIAREHSQVRADGDVEAQRIANEKKIQEYRETISRFNAEQKKLEESKVSPATALNAAETARTYDEWTAAIKKCKTALQTLDESQASQKQQADSLRSAIQTLTRSVKNYEAQLKGSEKPTLVSATDAYNVAKQTKSINDLKEAYRQLNAVIAEMPRGSQGFESTAAKIRDVQKELERSKNKLKEFKGEMDRTQSSAGQLRSMLIQAFSIQSIVGFIKQMVDVRAQFELQRVALGAILQDTEEANKVFTQIQQMALQSPFSIMQLERATKQMAAFGVEAKKLPSTMKMIADVSAGLGVEIDRLILVYGHIKATNFMQGMHLRQFTNAGLNMLQELSKYYSELEGRVVSVGEVSDRVRKKMVKFTDVEAVLKRITSEGGMFYNMQQKQSESIWGQMQRITDAYDLMLNDIGRSNEGVIKSVLTGIRNLITNWRIAAKAVVPLIAAIGSFATAVAVIKTINNLVRGYHVLARTATVATLGWKAAFDGMKFAEISTGIGAIVAVIGTVIAAIYELTQNSSKLKDDLEFIDQDMFKNIDQSVDKYEELATVIANISTSEHDRLEAQEKLKNQFGEILDDYYLSIDYIKQHNHQWNEAIDHMKAYYRAEALEKKKQTVADTYLPEIEKQIKQTYDDQEEAMNKLGMNRTDWTNIARKVMQPYIDGTKEVGKDVVETWKMVANDIQNTYVEYMGKSLDFSGTQTLEGLTRETYGKSDLHDAIEQLQNYRNGLAECGEAVEDFDSKQAEMEAHAIYAGKNAANAVIEHANSYQSLLEQLQSAQFKAEDLSAEIEKLKSQGMNTDDKEQELQDLQKEIQATKDAIAEFIKKIEETYGIKISVDTDAATKNVNSLNDAVLTLLKNLKDLSDRGASEGFNWFQYDDTKGGADWWKQGEDTPYVKDLKSQGVSFGDTLGAAAGDAAAKAFNQTLQPTLDKYGDTAQQKVNDRVYKIVTGLGIAGSKVDKFYKDAESSTSEFAKTAKANYERISNDAQKYARDTSGAWKEANPDFDPTEAKKEAAAWKQIALAYDPTIFDKKGNKKTGKGEDKVLKLWQDRLKAIQDFYKQADELSKKYSDEKTKDVLSTSFKDYFEGLKMDVQKYVDAGLGKDAAVQMLEEVSKEAIKERPKLAEAFNKAISDYKVQIGFEIQDKGLADFSQAVDELFANLELTKELAKNNLNVDLVSFVGGTPMDMDELKKRYAETKKYYMDKYQFGMEYEKKLAEIEKKITQYEQKELKERLNNYREYLAQSYGERAKYLLDTYAQMSKMESDFMKAIADARKKINAEDTTKEEKEKLRIQISQWQYELITGIDNIKKQIKEKMSELDFNQLMNSPLFAEMFQDLGSLSNKVLDTMLEKLKTVGDTSNLTLSQIQKLSQYTEKVRNAMVDNSPFKGAFEAIKKAYQLRRQGVTAKSANDDLAASQQQLYNLEQQRDDLEFIIGLQSKQKDINSDIVDLSENQKGLLGQGLVTNKMQLQTVKLQIDNQKKLVQTNQGNVQTYKLAVAATEKLKSSLQKAGEAGKAGISAVREGMAMFGKTISDADEAWLEFVEQMIDQGIELGIMFTALGIKINESLGIIGIIATALTVCAGLFKAILNSHDNRLTKQIEDLQNNVDDLSRAFEKLSTAVQEAFTMTSLVSSSSQAEANIKRQIELYNQMIALEQQKKKTDDDKIREYQQAIEDLNDDLKELHETKLEALGGFGSDSNIQSAAEAFAEAWLDAYKETGDGLEALQDKWDEYIDNLVIKQMYLRVVSKRMQRLFDMVDSSLEASSAGGENLTSSELQAINAEKDRITSQLNEELKDWITQLGYIGGSGDNILSDLQQGISNITESQAAALESYVNSIRFYVVNSNEKLTSIVEILRQYNSTATPMYSLVQQFKSAFDDFSRRFFSMCEKSGNGYALRVK